MGAVLGPVVAWSSRIWVISNDFDYTTKFGKNRLINAALRDELAKVVGVTLDVRCFDTLAAGIADWKKTTKSELKTMPSPTELKAISDEEGAVGFQGASGAVEYVWPESSVEEIHNALKWARFNLTPYGFDPPKPVFRPSNASVLKAKYYETLQRLEELLRRKIGSEHSRAVDAPKDKPQDKPAL